MSGYEDFSETVDQLWQTYRRLGHDFEVQFVPLEEVQGRIQTAPDRRTQMQSELLTRSSVSPGFPTLNERLSDHYNFNFDHANQ